MSRDAPDPEFCYPAGSGSMPDPDMSDPAGSGSKPDKRRKITLSAAQLEEIGMTVYPILCPNRNRWGVGMHRIQNFE